MGPSFWWGPTPFDFLYWNSYSPYGVNRSRPAPLRADKHLRTDIRAKECTNPARQARDAPPRARHVPRRYEEPPERSFLASVSGAGGASGGVVKSWWRCECVCFVFCVCVCV